MGVNLRTYRCTWLSMNRNALISVTSDIYILALATAFGVLYPTILVPILEYKRPTHLGQVEMYILC